MTQSALGRRPLTTMSLPACLPPRLRKRSFFPPTQRSWSSPYPASATSLRLSSNRGGASAGAVPLPAGFLRTLRGFTAAHGVCLIFDEVITGFRWSPGGAQQAYGIQADLVTLAKILAGGLPGGAVTGRRNILDALGAAASTGRRIRHPGTFNGNPLSAAAGIACLDVIADGTTH